MTAAFNSEVDVTVEAAFGYAPYNTTPVWTDISSYVRRLSINRGRGHDLDRIGASTATLQLDNTTGRFDPTYVTGAYYPNVVPMVPIRVVATYATVNYPLFYGFVTEWPLQWTLDEDALVNAAATDGIMLLNLTNSGTANVQENTGTRIGNLLDDTSWPAAWRSIATGDVTAAAYTPDCGVVWSLIQQVMDTEGGLCHIAGDGAFTFQNRDYRSGATTTATFGDSGSEIRYEDVQFGYDDFQIYNRVEVSRVDGATVGAENATSITNFGRRLLSVNDTLHVDDTAATTHATNMVTRYNDPHVLLKSLRVNPARSGTWGTVLGLEISDLVTIRRRPSWAGNVIDVDVFVESINTSIDAVARVWTTTISGTQYV